jgi:hypothetical protein
VIRRSCLMVSDWFTASRRLQGARGELARRLQDQIAVALRQASLGLRLSSIAQLGREPRRGEAHLIERMAGAIVVDESFHCVRICPRHRRAGVPHSGEKPLDPRQIRGTSPRAWSPPMLSPRSAREAARAVVSDLAGLPVCPVTGTTDNHECQRRETPNRTGERHQLNYTIARACPLCRFKPGAWDRSTAVSLKTGTLRLSHSILGKTRDAPMSTPIAISRKCARDPEGPPDSVSATGCTTPPGLGLLSGDTAWVLAENPRLISSH